MLKLRNLSFLMLTFVLTVVGAVAQAKGKNPVIVIPGLSGSQLINAKGEIVWFGVKRDKTDDIRLPITSPVLSRNRDALRVGDIIREVDIKFLPDVEVYKSVIEALNSRGYTEANWNKPQAADVFYVFPYDWRRDNVESARLLMRKMSAVKKRLKKPNLKFDILAHSMGGLVARYAAMYGTADLPTENPSPTWAGAVHINKLMMFGTPNSGSFSAFDALLNGSPIVLGKKLPLIDDFRPEDVFSSPSVFQLLPHNGTAKFLDENLHTVNVDLYEPETWFKYGWGPLADPKFLSKLKDAGALAFKNKEIKPKPLDEDANLDDRLTSQTTFAQGRAFFASALNRAKLFHAALDAPPKNTPLKIYAYGGNCEQTLNAAILLYDQKGDKWTTVLDARDIKSANGKPIKKDEVKALIFALGDGRVTQHSVLAAKETTINGKPEFTNSVFPVTSSFFACSSHVKLFLEKPIQDSFLSALVVEKQNQP